MKMEPVYGALFGLIAVCVACAAENEGPLDEVDGASTPAVGGSGQSGATSNGGRQGNGMASGGAAATAPGGAGSPAGGKPSVGGTPGAGGTPSAGGAPMGGASGGPSVPTGGSAGAGGASEPSQGGCLDGITDFGKAGPFTTMTKRSGSINFYVPSVPSGCRVPVVHLANGTGATCATYQQSLSRLASHGFLAACYESANTGAGDQGLSALETAFKEFPDLADQKLGSMGHSQGGQAAFTVLALAEKKFGTSFKYAGFAMQPASGFGAQPRGASWQSLYKGIASPMFMFSGVGSDGLVSQGWVQQAFDATSPSEEAYFWAKQGSRHIPVPNGETMQVSIPWFRWKLLGDATACKAFKSLPMSDTSWKVVKAKNEAACP